MRAAFALDDPEEPVQIILAGPAGPVVLHGDEFIDVADFPAALREGAGARGRAVEILPAEVVDPVGIDAVLLDEGRVHHKQLGQRADEGREGFGQCEAHGVVVHSFHGVFVGDVAPAEVRWAVDFQNAVETVGDRVGVDRAAIVEDGVFVEVEGPYRGGIVNTPVLHQEWQNIVAAVDEKRIIEAAQRRIDGVILANGRVDDVDVLVTAVEQDVFTLRGQRSRRHQQQRHQKQRRSCYRLCIH